ncbi:MAG: hypothetical protein V4629_05085 [Pseudomonadota bacterium]
MQTQILQNTLIAGLAFQAHAQVNKNSSAKSDTVLQLTKNLSSLKSPVPLIQSQQANLRGARRTESFTLIELCDEDFTPELTCEQFKEDAKNLPKNGQSFAEYLGSNQCDYFANLDGPTRFTGCFGEITTTEDKNCAGILGGYLVGQLDKKLCFTQTETPCNSFSPTPSPTPAPYIF